MDSRRQFTLIELLACLVIVAILLGLALAGLQGFGRDHRPATTCRMMTAALRMVRVEALQKRRRVALLLPGPEAPLALQGISFCYAYVGTGLVFEKPVPATKLEWTIRGTSLSSVYATEEQRTGPDECQYVRDVDWSQYGQDGGETQCRAVVFSRYGRLSDSYDRYILVSGRRCRYRARVDGLTGRIEVLDGWSE